MKLFVGLGNPGKKYEKNRHNVGFMFVDFMLEQLSSTPVDFTYDSYMHGYVARIRTESEEFVFLKPKTFMNKSGETVKVAVKKYFQAEKPASPCDLVVVHDDLDIPFGMSKVQIQGPKLHNGVESIENHLRTTDFLRIRIGVDNRDPSARIPGETYVLQDFRTEEYISLPDIFKKVKLRFEAYLQSNSNCT